MAKSLEKLSTIVSSVNSDVVSFTEGYNEFLKEQAYGVVSTEIPNVDGSGNPLALGVIQFEEDMKGKMLRYSKVVLTFPDGSNPLIISNDIGNQPVTGQEDQFTVRYGGTGAEIFPDTTYPVGSLILGLDYEANSINAAAGDATNQQEIQYNWGGKLASSGVPANEGGTPQFASFYYERSTGVVNAEAFSGDGSALTNLPATSSSGASGDVQYNDGSNGFAGESDFNYDDTTNILSVPSIDASGDISANTFTGNGANLTGLPASGSNTHVQFNDVGSLSGYSTFTFNKYNGNLNAPRFLGENISGSVYQDSSGYSAMYLTPDDFRPTNNTSYSGFISNNGGRMGWGSTSYSHYATFQVPKGYKVTGVDLKGSANYSFFLYASTWSSGTATYKATGTINTALTLLSYQQLIGNSGDYFTIRFQPSSYGNYIYGCKLLLYPT
jgi:hypothetical protein